MNLKPEVALQMGKTLKAKRNQMGLTLEQVRTKLKNQIPLSTFGWMESGRIGRVSFRYVIIYTAFLRLELEDLCKMTPTESL